MEEKLENVIANNFLNLHLAIFVGQHSSVSNNFEISFKLPLIKSHPNFVYGKLTNDNTP